MEAAGVDEDGVDRFSALPDAVLGEIISLLPTEDGARTQILSPRWRHLWRSAPLNLDLHCNQLARKADLAGIVSRILSSHLAPARRFCLHDILSLSGGAQTIDAWLRSPVLDSLQELEFYQVLKLPPAPIFRFSPTLRVLHIGSVPLPDAITQGLHFPKLEQLGLRGVGISECSLHSLIDGCPALDHLLVRWSSGFRRLLINSLTLTSLGVDNYNSQRHGIELSQVIIHNAPCLQRLLLHLRTALDVLLVTAPKLETVGFLSEEDFISSQDQLNRLVLGSRVIQGLRVDKLAKVVCTVKILAIRMKALNLDTVIALLTCFPCLEKLYVRIRARKSESKNMWHRKDQNLLKNLNISLKTIVLGSYRGVKSQVNFVTFFVLNARLLESMTLQVDSKHYSEEFLAEQRRKLQLENRASRDAQFNFSTQSDVRTTWDMKHLRDLETDPFVW